MRVPEKSPNLVTEVPCRDPQEAAVPPVIHRTKRRSRALAVLAVVFGFLISFFFLFCAGAILGDEDLVGMGVALGVIGLSLLAVSLRGSWVLSKDPLIHVVTFEPDRVAWGYVGKEESVGAEQITSFDWAIDADNDLCLSFRAGVKRVSLVYIDLLVPRQQRPTLLAFLRRHYGAVLTESDHS